MKNNLLKTLAGLGMALLLGGCNVGSDEGTQSAANAGNININGTTSSSPASAQKVTAVGSQTNTPTDTYYLLLQGIDGSGQPVSHAIQFQRQVSSPDNPVVQLTWFQPNRNADGSCLRDLSGYELKYGQQANDYNTTLRFDLAAREMSCTSVGSTECGDVRECRYKLSL